MRGLRKEALPPESGWSPLPAGVKNSTQLACNLSPLFAVNCNSLLASSETLFPGKGVPQAPCASLVVLVWLHQIVIPSMLPLGPPQNLTKKKRESFLATLWIITQGPPKWSVCLRLIYLIVTLPWGAPHAQLRLPSSWQTPGCWSWMHTNLAYPDSMSASPEKEPRSVVFPGLCWITG